MAMKKKPSEDECKKTLRHFCSILFCNMDESMIYNSSGFWNFDQFFQEGMEATAENMAKFLGGVLKLPHVDDLTFQLAVERVVWDMVKYGYDKHCCDSMDREDLFRLFCIFNRLCDPHQMRLSKKATYFLFGKFDKKPPPAEEFGGTFANLSYHLSGWQKAEDMANLNYGKIIKKAYDDFVRDIIIEGRVKFRFSNKVSPRYSKSTIMKRTISITSRNLRAYEDEDDIDALDVPKKREPMGKVLYEMSLIGSENKILPNSKSIFASKTKKFDILCIQNAGSDSGIHILFDPGREIYDIYAWTQAIQESIENINSNSNRLIRLQLLLHEKVESDNETSGTEDGFSFFDTDCSSSLNEYQDIETSSNCSSVENTMLPQIEMSTKNLDGLTDTNLEAMASDPRNNWEKVTAKKLIHTRTYDEFDNVNQFLTSFASSSPTEEKEFAEMDEGSLDYFPPKTPPKEGSPLGAKPKIPPQKPKRKIPFQPQKSDKRYQDQYIDRRLLKMSSRAKRDTRADSFADYGDRSIDTMVDETPRKNKLQKRRTLPRQDSQTVSESGKDERTEDSSSNKKPEVTKLRKQKDGGRSEKRRVNK